MKIELTREQYLALVKLACLGNTVANDIRDDDERIEELDTAEQYILSLAGDFGFKELVEKDNDILVPGKGLADELDLIMSDFEDECFWDELVHRMARRDFIGKFGEAAVKKMKSAERDEKEEAFIEKYDRETSAHGIDNLKFSKVK